LDEAIAIQQEVAEGAKQSMGELNPNSLHALGNLSRMLFAKGEYSEAATIAREMLPKLTRVLGESHPDVLRSTARLGAVLCEMGLLDEALHLQQQVFEEQTRVLGDHPDTQRTQTRLKITQERMLAPASTQP
jgi:tetratricopeptide (TPR) repeat protein